MSQAAHIAGARVASVAMMASIVVLVVAQSTLVRWLAISAIILNLLTAAAYLAHLFRQRGKPRV